MNPFLQTIVNTKIKQLTPGELIQMAEQYDISLTKSEAEKIVMILQKENINIYNTTQLNQLLEKVRRIVGNEAAGKAAELLEQFQSVL
ncbi:DUF2624 family protein [Bacillus tianshenii]|nr:DUF2624 family protein [Bacillus tianshenii]